MAPNENEYQPAILAIAVGDLTKVETQNSDPTRCRRASYYESTLPTSFTLWYLTLYICLLMTIEITSHMLCTTCAERIRFTPGNVSTPTLGRGSHRSPSPTPPRYRKTCPRSSHALLLTGRVIKCVRAPSKKQKHVLPRIYLVFL